MISGGAIVSDATSPGNGQVAEGATTGENALDEVRASLRNLRYGSVTIIVQDGVIIQIDRTEKRRLQTRRGNGRGHLDSSAQVASGGSTQADRA